LDILGNKTNLSRWVLKFLSEGHVLIEFAPAIVFDVDASDASTQVTFV